MMLGGRIWDALDWLRLLICNAAMEGKALATTTLRASAAREPAPSQLTLDEDSCARAPPKRSKL